MQSFDQRSYLCRLLFLHSSAAPFAVTNSRSASWSMNPWSASEPMILPMPSRVTPMGSLVAFSITCSRVMPTGPAALIKPSNARSSSGSGLRFIGSLVPLLFFDPDGVLARFSFHCSESVLDLFDFGIGLVRPFIVGRVDLLFGRFDVLMDFCPPFPVGVVQLLQSVFDGVLHLEGCLALLHLQRVDPFVVDFDAIVVVVESLGNAGVFVFLQLMHRGGERFFLPLHVAADGAPESAERDQHGGNVGQDRGPYGHHAAAPWSRVEC